MSSTTVHPKLFISYSWSSPEHEAWVLQLATEVINSGVDVILDKWDLKKGHDAIAFMEQMVADDEIKKVAMIVDRNYAEKADGRSGGVGTETQIISKKVYEEQKQDKFVALVVEKDENGKPYSPIYYNSRIYIDFTESEKYAEKFEELLRWIFDKPLYVKPAIGKIPEYIASDNPIALPTSAHLKRTIELIKSGKPSSVGSLGDYLETLAEGLEQFRMVNKQGEMDDAMLASIEAFIPYRNEYIELLSSIGKYSTSDDMISLIHKFLERLISYTRPPKNVNSYSELDFDNFRFIMHELFLYTVAILIKYEKFDAAAYIIEQPFYVPSNAELGRETMVTNGIFSRSVALLQRRSQRLGLRRLSLRADLLKERADISGVDFSALMQADFVLYIRSQLRNDDDYWWPETLLYIGHHYAALEVFARAISKTYFDKMKTLLGISDPKDLDQLLDDFATNKKRIPRWDFTTFSPKSLMAREKLATIS